MFVVNIEENIRRWYRLTRHLQINAFDSCLCFLNPLSITKPIALNGSSDELLMINISSEVSVSDDNSSRIGNDTDTNIDSGSSGESANESGDPSFPLIVKSCCDVADSELVISPWLLYNRTGRHAFVSPEVCLHTNQPNPKNESTEAALGVLFYILRSTVYSVDVDFSCSVRAYLTEHRLYLDATLGVGDIIPIPLSEVDRRRHLSVYGSQPDYVLVKIRNIRSTGKSRLCYIDPQVTRLEVAGVCRDFIPNLAYSVHLDDDPLESIDSLFQRACRIISHSLLYWKDQSKTAYGLLLCGKAGFGQAHLVHRLARRFSLNLVPVYPHEVVAASMASSATALRSMFTNLLPPKAPCLLVLNDLQRMVRSREHGGRPDPELADAVIAQWLAIKETCPEFPVILCATIPADGRNRDEEETASLLGKAACALPTRLLRLFIERLLFPTPSRAQRELTLRRLSDRRYVTLPSSLLAYLAQRSAGFAFSHFNLLVDKLAAVSVDKPLTHDVCDVVLEEVFKLTGRRFRPADIPCVAWADVGGLEEVIDEIVSAVQLTGSGTGAGGILLYGPPGTGKTLLAKAVAKECNLNFISVKGPELLNMYVGQSEANIRDLFRRAREAAPCVVFCDELDSLAPRRGRAGDSGGVMDRVVSQLLSEMEASTERAPIQVIGATNRPDLLDAALLRPGRFDRLTYVGVSKSPATHAAILYAQTRNFPLAATGNNAEGQQLNIEEIVETLPRCVTGADIYAVCSEAWRTAVSRYIECQDGYDGHPVNGHSRSFFVSHEDFLIAAQHLVPSVSEAELERYEVIRQQFSQNDKDFGRVI